MQCLVLPGASARAVPVSVNPGVVRDTLLPGDSLLGVNALLPGMLVNAAVKEVGMGRGGIVYKQTCAFCSTPN